MEGCRLVDKEMDQSQLTPAKLSEEARRHLDRCERCRKLYQLAEPPLPEGFAETVSASILRSLPESIEPVQPRRSTRVLAGQLVLALVLIAGSAAAAMRFSGAAIMSATQSAVMAAALAAGMIGLALSLVWQSTPGSLPRVSAVAAIGIPGLAWLAGVAVLFPWQTPAPFLARGWLCLLGGLGIAVPSAAIFIAVLRGTVPVASGAWGATLGALSGLVGLTVLQFACDRQEGEHLLAWHGGALLLATLTGLLLWRLLQRKFQTGP